MTAIASTCPFKTYVQYCLPCAWLHYYPHVPPPHIYRYLTVNAVPLPSEG